jgi:hypothetical protein
LICFETVGRDSETPRAVTQAWIISFEQIQQQNAVAGELLSLMAFFDRQAIAADFCLVMDNSDRKDMGKYSFKRRWVFSRHFALSQ